MKHLNLRALVIGNILEYYDFFLYSFFVSILSPLFFPSSDPLTGLIMGFGVFAVGFISRPIGAIIFGHWGDKYGRKNALLVTLFLMALSTVGIGLLPTYGNIGVFAPVGLIFFRLLQGLAAGGEANGAAVFGIEQTVETKRGFIGSLIKSSTGIGAISATMMGALFSNQLMPDWAWRIPFCLGGIVAFAGIYLRRTLEEETRKIVRTPLLDVIYNYPISFLKTLCVGGFLPVHFYIIVGYMNPTLHARELISSFELMIMNATVTSVGVIIVPMVGYLSDKIGFQRLMIWGASGQLILALPLFMVYVEGDFFKILFVQMGFIAFCQVFVAPTNAYLNTLFPSECRYSGVAFGDCLGVAFFGGTTPLICSQMAQSMSPVAPSLYLMGMACLGLVAIGAKSEKFVNRFTSN